MALVLLRMSNLGACSCAESTIEEEYLFSPVIFMGKVTQITPVGATLGGDEGPQNKFDFQVTESFRGGDKTLSLAVFSAQDSAACGIEFEKNKAYIVFAFPSRNRLIANGCSRTAPLEAPEALADLSWLRENANAAGATNNCVFTKATYSGANRWIEVKNTCPWPIVIVGLNVYWTKNIQGSAAGESEPNIQLAANSDYTKIHTLRRRRPWQSTDFKYEFVWSTDVGQINYCHHWMQDPQVQTKVCLN